MGTAGAIIDVEQSVSPDVVNEPGAGLETAAGDGFEQKAHVAVELVFNLCLSAASPQQYRPGSHFWSKNHLLPCSE